MDAKQLLDLIGTANGPGWGTAAAVAAWLARLAVKFGELQALVRAIRHCPQSKCPLRGAAEDYEPLNLH